MDKEFKRLTFLAGRRYIFARWETWILNTKERIPLRRKKENFYP